MTATLPPMIRFQPLVAGAPLPGGKVYFYAAGTLTPQAAYAADGTTPLANPLTLDANGATDFRLGTGLTYKINLTDSVGGTVAGWPVDQIIGTDGILISLADTTSVALGDALVGVKQPFTGATARTQHDKNQDFVSVKDFGAKGDGTTDDTAAINTAIQSLTAGEVFLPAGTYKTTATINLKSGVSLRGSGPKSIIVPTSAVPNPVINGASLVGVNLSDFYVDCSACPTASVTGIAISGFQDSKIRGVTIYNAAAFGWLIFSAVRSKFIGNTINITRKWDGMTISTGSSDNVIIGNTVIDSYDSGIGFTDTLGTTCIGNYVNRSKIAGNWYAPGIDASGAKNVVIAGNFVKGNLFGISLLQHPNTGKQPKRITCSGNTVGDGSYGIICNNVAVIGPAVSEATTRDGIVISGNTIFNQDVCGILVEGATDGLVANNQVSNSAMGINAFDNLGIDIKTNTCSVCAIGISTNGGSATGNLNTRIAFNSIVGCATPTVGPSGTGISYRVHNLGGSNSSHEAFVQNWDFDGHLQIGGYHFWVDGVGKFRIKNGFPTSDTDGSIVGTQT